MVEADYLFNLASAYALTRRTAEVKTALAKFCRVELQDTIADWRRSCSW
jgi:hypothetical protein